MLLERLAKLAETADSRGLLKSIKLITDENELLQVTKIIVKIGPQTDVLRQIIKHAICIGADKSTAYILSRCEEFTLQDVLEFVVKITQAHIIFNLHSLCTVQLSINDVLCVSSVYKKYRCERFSIFRMAGMSPNVAHHLNEWMF